MSTIAINFTTDTVGFEETEVDYIINTVRDSIAEGATCGNVFDSKGNIVGWYNWEKNS